MKNSFRESLIKTGMETPPYSQGQKVSSKNKKYYRE
jgi:hypothetical protein